jgi:hypothetical protein
MPGLIRGVARTAVVAGTATAVSNRVSRRQAGRWAAQEDQQYAQQQQQYAEPPPQQYAPPPQQYAAPPPQYAEPAPAPPPPPAPAAEAPAADDMSQKLAMLQQLAGLKAQGILTEEEFEAQKAKLLAS